MAPAPKIPDWKLRTRTGSTVQGSPRRQGQKPESVAEETARKARERADRNQKRPPPKDSPAGPRKSTPVNNPALAGRFTTAAKNYQEQQKQRQQHEEDTKPLIGKLPKGGALDGKGPMKSQPGPGAPTGGTGRDADGGRGRTEFEDDRRGRMQGGKDRPPIYKPKDDGQRGGYINRSNPLIKKKPGINTGSPRIGVKGMTTLVS